MRPLGAVVSRRHDLGAVPEGANGIRIHFDENEPPAVIFNEAALPSALVSWAWSQLTALNSLISALSIDSGADGSPADVAASVQCVLGPVINALRFSEERAEALRRAANSPAFPPSKKRKKQTRAKAAEVESWGRTGSMMINDLKVAFASVKGALRRRGRSKQDAEDLVQEAFLRLLSYERGHTVANPDAFLMTAALNLSIDTYRTHLRRGEEVLLDTVLLVDTAPGLEDVLLSRERVRRLRTGLARLDETTRTIFLAHRLVRIHGVGPFAR
jgi:hypothetical protein